MCAFHKQSEPYCGLFNDCLTVCFPLLFCISHYVYDVVVKSSRSLSHLLMSFLLLNVVRYGCSVQPAGKKACSAFVLDYYKHTVLTYSISSGRLLHCCCSQVWSSERQLRGQCVSDAELQFEKSDIMCEQQNLLRPIERQRQFVAGSFQHFVAACRIRQCETVAVEVVVDGEVTGIWTGECARGTWQRRGWKSCNNTTPVSNFG